MQDLTLTPHIQERAGAGDFVALAALVIWVLVTLAKSAWIPVEVPPRARPILALGLGQVFTVLVAVVDGASAGQAVVSGLVASALAIAAQEAGSAFKGSQPPGSAGSALLLIALAGAAAGLSTGCGGSQELAKYAEAGRDIAARAEPCLVAQKAMDESQCGTDAACLATVKETYGKLADALDLMHSTWCKVSPQSEGCLNNGGK